MGGKHGTLRERFDRFVVRGDPNECWIWRGARDSRGYGKLNVAGRLVGAHRLAWELEHGPISDGLHVCHRCDVRACMNPAHLFLGTNADNVRDCIEKGRAVAPPVLRGEENHAAKLTQFDVEEIRRALSNGESGVEIARRFGVAATTISAIRIGKTWATR